MFIKGVINKICFNYIGEYYIIKMNQVDMCKK